MKCAIAGLAGILLVAACASYEQPSEAAPHAKVTFERSAGSGGNIVSQGRLLSYYVATNEQCSEAPRVAFFGTGDLSGNEKSIRLKPGQTTKLLAFLEVNEAGGAGVNYGRTGQTRCVSEASFAPADGESYTISLDALEGAECTLSVIEETNDSPPADLVIGS